MCHGVGDRYIFESHPDVFTRSLIVKIGHDSFKSGLHNF